MSEEDPKLVAKRERASPEVERSLRQFLNVDGPKGASKAYREGWDRIFGKKPPKCVECGAPVEEEDLKCQECWDREQAREGG